jgi:PAS domain S-box-containing protein
VTASAWPSAEAYRALFEHCLDAVFFTAPDGRVFAANPAACAMFGYTEEELCALGREGISDPADRERAAAAVARRAAARHAQAVLSYRRRDGTTFPGEVSSRIFTDASGEKRTCTVLRDITEREQLRERLAAQLRQTQEASDELASFTNCVVHDLRVPLRAMNAYSLTLAEDYGDRLDDTAQDLLDRIREATRKTDALLHDLSRWSRLGRAELHRAPADLSAMARESAGLLQAGHPDRDVTLLITDGVTGSADPDLIRTVLDNLLDNAWKYTARQPHPVISFGATTTGVGGLVTYFVADNGAGFDSGRASGLFQPFQRLHGAEYPGTGLGLASVKRIIDRHGGRVWAEAAVGHGATFSFTLEGLAPDAARGNVADPRVQSGLLPELTSEFARGWVDL